MSFYYCCNDCRHFEKRDEQATLVCPSCESEMIEAEPPSDAELHDLFDEYLDYIVEPFRVGSLNYAASNTFKEVDPIAYRCSFDDWLDAETSEDKFVEFDGKTFYAFN